MNRLHVLRNVRALRLEPILVGDVREWDELAFRWGPAVLAGDGVGLLVAQGLDGARFASAAAVVSLEPEKEQQGERVAGLNQELIDHK